MKRAKKGTFGYIAKKRQYVILRTILFFGISLALFVAGYIATGTRKNLLTVVAVLGCLPACKSMVNMIMFIKAAGCSTGAREILAPLEGRLTGMYDMYFTSYQKDFAISHMVVGGKTVLGYTESDKCDRKACEEHLKTMLKQAGLGDLAITVSNDIDKYSQQLKNLNEREPEASSEKEDEIRAALYDISL